MDRGVENTLGHSELKKKGCKESLESGGGTTKRSPLY